MKKQILSLAGLLILLVLPLTLMAQDRGQGQGRSQGDRAEFAKKQRAELKKTLGLKKDQVAKFEKIYADFDKKRNEMFESMRDGGDRSGMREKMTKMNTTRDEALKKVLDKGQAKKFEAHLKKQAKDRENRGGRGGDGRR